MAVTLKHQKQLNIRVEPDFFRVLENLARQEKRSVSQMARLLIEKGIKGQPAGETASTRYRGDLSNEEIAALGMAGKAFDWLTEELDLYDDTCGEPL